MGADGVPVDVLDKASKIRIYGEVFTPQRIVDQMCDALPDEAWEPTTTFLEPTCGDGVFVVEILRRKFGRCKKRGDYTEALKSVYAMEIQPDNVAASIENVKTLCREYFKPTKAEEQIIEDHVIQADSLKVMKMINDMNRREEVHGRKNS